MAPNLTCIALNIADKRSHLENEKCEATSVGTGSRWPHRFTRFVGFYGKETGRTGQEEEEEEAGFSPLLVCGKQMVLLHT